MLQSVPLGGQKLTLVVMSTSITNVSDESSYSLEVLPKSDAGIVKIEKGRLLGAIDLEALVDDLGRLGNCVRIAYHGVAGHTDLQIEIQRVGYDVTKLCDKSAITVGNFKNASSTVLSSLKSTYEYLLEGFEDMAIDTLSDVTDTAKEMAIAAQKLHDDFEQQSEKVIAALEKTQKTEEVEQKRKEEMQRKRAEMEEEKAKQDELSKQAEQLASQAKVLYDHSEEKEYKSEEAIRSLKNEQQQEQARESGFFRKIGRGLFGSSDVQATDYSLLISSEKDAAQAARKTKIQQLEKMNEHQTLRSKALADLSRAMAKIGNLKGEEKTVDIAIEALYNAISALKSLAAVMLQAARFWEQMQTHCEMLAKGEIKREIEKVLNYSEERRIKFWTSKGFVGKAVKYYAGWVALDDVCSIYMERIRLTQRELYIYIQEALPPTEARKKVSQLAKCFQVDLQKQQDAITERKLKQDREIDSLKEDCLQASKTSVEEVHA